MLTPPPGTRPSVAEEVVWEMSVEGSALMGFNEVARVSGPDLMPALCAHSTSEGYRHFLYGGAPGVPERLAENLRCRFPGLRIVGTYSPPFRSLTEAEDAEVVRMINESKADIVWVGLSTPKQERWMPVHVGRLTAPALLGVGADYEFRHRSNRSGATECQNPEAG